MGEKLYDCVLLSFQWNELIYTWQSEGFFESDAGMLLSYGIPEDACNFKVIAKERKND